MDALLILAKMWRFWIIVFKKITIFFGVWLKVENDLENIFDYLIWKIRFDFSPCTYFNRKFYFLIYFFLKKSIFNFVSTFSFFSFLFFLLLLLLLHWLLATTTSQRRPLASLGSLLTKLMNASVKLKPHLIGKGKPMARLELIDLGLCQIGDHELELACG